MQLANKKEESEKFSFDRESFVVGKASTASLCGISRQAFDMSHWQRVQDLRLTEEIAPRVWLFYPDFIQYYAPWACEVRRRVAEDELGAEYGYAVEDYEKFKEGTF